MRLARAVLFLLLLAFCPDASAVINRYVNTGSTAGGDGTTNNTSGSTRAFASLSEALGVIDNATLTDDVVVYCSGSTADTTQVGTIDVNSSTYMLTLTTTGSQRHKGKWDSSIYRLEVTGGSYAFRNNATLRLTVDGLQIKAIGSNMYGMKLLGANHAGAYDVTYKNNIVWGTSTTGTQGILSEPPASGSGTTRAINNIIYGFNVGIGGAAGSSYKVWNNTVANCTYGIVADGAFVATNNLVYGATGSGFVGSFDASSNYNAESDGNGAPGANSRTSQAFTFLDAAGSDFRLSLADAGARDHGVTDPSGASFYDYDIGNYTRSGTWDIGAWEAHASIALTGTATESITEADIVAGGKTIILTLEGDAWVPANGTPAYSTGTAKATTGAPGRDGNGDLTISWPTSYSAVTGHFAVAVVYLDQGTASTPTNWTAMTGSPFGSGTEKLYVFYRVLASGDSEPVTTISSSASGASIGANMAVYTGVGSIGAIGTGNQGTGTPMSATGVTTTADNSIVAFACGRGDNENSSAQTFNASATGVTERLDGGTSEGNDSQVSLADKTFASSGSASGNGSSTTSATDPWVCVMFEGVRNAPFAAARQAIINGLDSAQSEGAGWDAVVKATQGTSGVVRTSDSVLTITLDAFAGYNISAQETVTATLPTTSMLGASSVVASPTFTIDPTAGGSTPRRRMVIVQ